MKYTYIPKGVCSRQINLEINDGIIESCEFIGGRRQHSRHLRSCKRYGRRRGCKEIKRH